MNLIYVANARMPTEKAHGIQIAKMCEAFIEAGVDLTLVVPRRASDPRSLREFYGLRVDVPVTRLWVVDWYARGTLGFAFSSLTFMLSYLWFLLRHTSRAEVLYTVDMDTFSSAALTLVPLTLFSEMHGAKKATLFMRFLMRRVRGIIAINRIIVDTFTHTFPSSPARYAVEPNGVDLAQFGKVEKREARQMLGLPHDQPIVLYTGRLIDWKGLEILPRAASLTPGVAWYLVGGTKECFTEMVAQELPGNFYFAGSRPFTEMPLWYAAADALVVLGTKRDTQSYYWTSPMKLFECFAAERPIVVSRTPALGEIVSDSEVFFYEPDDARDLAHRVQEALAGGELVEKKVKVIAKRAIESSWSTRARRILDFIEETIRV